MAFFKKLKKDIGLEEPAETIKEQNEADQDQPKQEKTPDEADKITVKEDKNKKNLTLNATTEKFNNKNRKNEKLMPDTRGDDTPEWLKIKGQLAVDVYQTEEEFCVQAPIAGVGQENIFIAIEKEMLVIKGEREEQDKNKDKEYFYQECYWGPFSRQIILPEDADVKNIKAFLKKGVLSIKIPRVKLDHKQIKIEVED